MFFDAKWGDWRFFSDVLRLLFYFCEERVDITHLVFSGAFKAKIHTEVGMSLFLNQTDKWYSPYSTNPALMRNVLKFQELHDLKHSYIS